MHEDSQALPPNTIIEEFRIEHVLGAGGFGITYLATDTSLGRQVVIKENLPSQFAFRDTKSGTVKPRNTSGGGADDYEWSMQNFIREAETVASLDHPGIVKVLRKFTANGTAYFVMPYVEGLSFEELIQDRHSKNQAFSEDELRGLIINLLNALAYLHDRGIYHRDIKPGNILISIEGTPILIDFGSARQRISERSMTVIESAGYTPFEQLQSKGNIGPWSDLYSLAATLVKAITLEAPPKAADRIIDDPWQSLHGNIQNNQYSDKLLLGIDKALSIQIKDRWSKADAWLANMTKMAEENHTAKYERYGAASPTPEPVTKKPVFKNPRLPSEPMILPQLCQAIPSSPAPTLERSTPPLYNAPSITRKSAQPISLPPLPSEESTPHSLQENTLRLETCKLMFQEDKDISSSITDNDEDFSTNYSVGKWLKCLFKGMTNDGSVNNSHLATSDLPSDLKNNRKFQEWLGSKSKADIAYKYMPLNALYEQYIQDPETNKNNS